MRFTVILIIAFTVFLVHGFISSPNGYNKNLQVRRELYEAKKHTRTLREKNEMLRKNINNLRDGNNLETAEDVARADLGMIKEGEVFYRVVRDEGR